MFTPFAFIQPITTVTPIGPTSANYLLIGGAFTSYNAPTLSRIAKIDSTGNLDTSFNMGTGFDGVPFFLQPQSDGKYLVGGQFTTYSGSSTNTTRLMRLNPNGTQDTTFVTGTGASSTVYNVVTQSDGSIIAVGQFGTYNSINSAGIAKINSSGTLDASFNVGFGISGLIPDIITQNDGKHIAIGSFQQYSQSNNYITRTDLSGSRTSGPGTDFNYGQGPNSPIYTSATQSDGKIIYGGDFNGFYSSSAVSNAVRILRINTNGTQDTTFVSGTGFNNSVYKILVQPDGKIIAIGTFTTYSGSSANGVIRLNNSGTIDNTFNVGAGLSISTGIDGLIQPDNKILVAGAFTSYSGSTANRLVRINNSGTLDTTLNIGTGFDNNVNSISLQPDGKIVASGLFLNFSGSSNNRIVRLNNSGSKDTSFVTGTGGNGNIYKNAIEPTTGKIIATGQFTTYSGSSSNRIVRINSSGTVDTSFNVGTGLNTYTVSPAHLSVEFDGKVYVGADFATYSGSTVNNFVRINPSGTVDTTFNGSVPNPSYSTNFSTTVYSVIISGSNIYFAGSFRGYKSTKGIMRLNSDGTQDTSYYIGDGTDVVNSSYGYCLLYQPDGKTIFAGNFTTYSGSTANYLTRLNSDGTIDPTFNSGTGFNGPILATAIQSDGKLIAYGNFTTYSSSTSNRLVRINPSGTLDTTFNVGSGINSGISVGPGLGKIKITSDGKIYVTGVVITTYSGSVAGNIIRINSNGTLDTTFETTSSVSFNSTGKGLINSTSPGGYGMVLSGSSVIVTGQFQSYKNPLTPYGLMINDLGSISSSFDIGAGFSSTVRTWVTQSDRKILAGGDFSTYSGSGTNSVRLVKLNRDGTRDTSFVTGTGFNSSIYNLLIQPDDKIIAVGTFTTYSGSTNSGIVRINTNGTKDTTFNVGAGLSTATGYHSIIQSDGKIVAVGGFTSYSGSASTRIVRINTNGTLDTTFNVGTGLNSTPEAILLQSDGKIVVTGNFTSYSGSSINRIVRINNSGTIDNTFNVGTGLASTGYALAYQSDGKIICSTLNSTTYSGSTARYLLRINTSGSLDNTFGFYPPSGLSTATFTPNSLKIDSNGLIYWGNSFTTYSGSFVPNRIVRIKTDGAVDDTFNQSYPNIFNSTGKGANNTVNAILLL